MKRTLLWGLTSGILLLGPVFAQQQGVVNTGAGRTFKISDLTGDKLGRIVASTDFQVSITLPVEVQNVGVNTQKQNVLIPTIDESDGRVIYLDVLKAGGYATLNIRLVHEGEPIILKLTVELSDKTSGVLSYAVRDDRTAQTASPAPVAASTSTPPTVTRPLPLSMPSTAGLKFDTSEIQIDLTRNQDRSNDHKQVFDYSAKYSGQAKGISFVLSPKVYLRSPNRANANALPLQPAQPTVISPTGIKGSLILDTSALDPSTVVLFVVTPVNTKTQNALPSQYVGVKVKP